MSRVVRSRFAPVAALLVGPTMAALVAAAHVADGAALSLLLQPSAALVVFGGTTAAVVVSFPRRVLWRTWRAVVAAFAEKSTPDLLRVRLGEYALRARQRGALALEGDAASNDDPFLRHALSLVVDGVPAADVRHTLMTFSQAREEADAECAVVLESAAGYAPTLGLLGAVLGLMQAMTHLGDAAHLGPGVATAFVATVYGVGLANLVLLPLAARVRGVGRAAALARELIIEGATAIQQGMHPTVVDTHLRGLLTARHVPMLIPAPAARRGAA